MAAVITGTHSMNSILIALVAALALHHLIYAIQNLVNIRQAHGFVKTVFGQDEAPFYPRSMVPAIRNPLLVWAGLIVIIAFELAAGLLLAAGALAMFGALGSPADFVLASQWAVLGCGVALLLWFGLFLTVAAAGFQMWQMQLGEGAMRGAFYSGVFSGLVLVLLRAL